MKRSWVSMMVIAMAVPVVGVASPAASTSAEATPSMPTSVTTARPQSAGSSDDATGPPVAAAPQRVQQALHARIETDPSAVLTVEVVTTGTSAEAAAAAVGGDVVRELDGLALVTIPARQVGRLSEQAGVSHVRLPTDMRQVMARSLPPVTEKGPVQSYWTGQAGRFLGPGDGGIGQRVGVIGLFDATVLAQQVSRGEVGSIPAARTTCISAGAECGFGTPGADYGNALLEVISDAAPFADLYLAELGGGTDYLAVIDWMAARGVTTLLHYWTAPYDGAGSGTGFSASVVNYAVNKGILWVNAAGELGSDPMFTRFAGPHWRGTWSDSDNDRWLNFNGADESITAYCGSLMGLRWNDWGAVKTDYDLHISDYRASSNTNGARQLVSGFNQATGGAAPLEANDFRWLCNHDARNGPVYDTDGDNYVSLWVYRTNRSTQTPVGDLLEITVLNGWLEYSNNIATIAVPFADTNNPGALVIGAGGNGSVPWWASRGPTNDGRIRPDFAAETCILTSLTPITELGGPGCSYGLTDSAGPAATIAGFAAVLSPRQSVTRPTDRSRHLIDLVKLRTPVVGRTNDVGWGIYLWPDRFSAAKTLTTANPLRLLAAPVRILETRPSSGLVGTTTPGPVPADTSVKLSLAGRGLIEGDVALLNVTLVTPPALGWVQAYPSYMSWVGASSNLNVASVGSTVPNLVAVRVDVGSTVSVYNRGGGHLVVDLLGSFSSNFNGPLTKEGRYVGLDPYRVADTTTCAGIPVGCTGSPLGASSAVKIPLAGTSAAGNLDNGIPATGNYAAVVSVTATPVAPGGWASALPGGSTGSPSTSTLNFSQGRAVTNMAIVPLSDAEGAMRLFTSAAAHYRVDVLGYFRVPTTAADLGGLFVAPAPTRLLDSRLAGGSLVPANGTIGISLGDASRWSGSNDVWLNLTSTNATASGQLQLSASAGTPQGNHVNVSVGGANRTVASSAITRLDQGTAAVRTSMPTHVIADLVGWFTPPEEPAAPGQWSRVTRLDGSALGTLVHPLDVSTDHGTMLLSGGVASPSVVAGSRITRWDRTDDTFTSVDVRADNSVFYAKASLSGDGSTVLLMSQDNNIVPGDTDGETDVFARTAAGVLEMVSVNSAEQQTTMPIFIQSASDDGRFVVLGSSNPVPGWGSGFAFIRDRTAGTTTPVQSLLPPGSDMAHEAAISPDGTHLVAVLKGATVTASNGEAHTQLSVAFIEVGGAVKVVPYAIAVGFDTQAPITDVAADGASAVVGGWLVGNDGSFTAVPAQELSADRSVAHRTCFTFDPDDHCLFFTPTGGAQRVYRTESGAVPDGSLGTVMFHRDGVLYLSSSATNLSPDLPGTFGTSYLYMFDPTP